MSEDFSASIEDYLVGLAASLQHAQRQLSALTVPGEGARPTVSYQLPKLDFELKLSLELSEEASSSAGSGTGVAMRGRLLNATGSRTQSAEAASRISGSFVAVPLDGGKPPPVLATRIERSSLANHFSIIASMTTATGEPLVDVDVHFNADRRLAAELNPAVEPPASRPLHAVVRTGKDGRASNLLDASAEPAGTRVPLMIDALGRTTTIVFVVVPPDKPVTETADDDG